MIRFLIKLSESFVVPLLWIVVISLVFFMNLTYDLGLNALGMRPWDFAGLIGILTMPFLHGDIQHLLSNSIPLLVSMSFIRVYFQTDSNKIYLYIALLAGALLWFLGARGSIHIGASGLVYGYISFLIVHALINRNKETMAAALLLSFLYGGLIYGLFPDYGMLVGKNISWEGHLAGTISGSLFAYIFRRKGPQRKIYFDDEQDDEDDHKGDHTRQHYDQEFRIHYHYTPKSDEQRHDL